MSLLSKLTANENKTIRERILKFSITALIVAVSSLILVLGGVAIGFQISDINSLHNAETKAVAEQVSGWFNERATELHSIKETIESYDMTANKNYKLAEYLGYMLKQNEDKGIFDYYVGMADTTCYFGGGWEPAPGEYDPTTRDWYKNSIDSTELYVSEAYVDAETGRVVITMAEALKSKDKVVGVLAADIFTDDIATIARESFGEDSSLYVSIVDKAGTVIAHKNEEYAPKVDSQENEILTTYTDASIPESLITPDGISRSLGKDFEGIFKVYTSMSLPHKAGTVVIVDTGLHCYSGILLFIVLCIVLFIVLFFLCKYFTKKFMYPMLNPMEELQGMADNMAKGKLDYTATYRRNDEIGTVCVAIENSNKVIQSYIEDISDKLELLSNGDLTSRIDEEYIGDFVELKDSINKISESLSETILTILKATESIRDGATNVASEAEKLSSKVVDVNTQLNTSVEGMNNIQERFEDNLRETENSMELSNINKESIDRMSERMKELTSAMKDISKKSKDISGIIDVINDIAAQTNILALNASIEAARVGDVGKGFAVVANSVRDLASQTSEAVSNSGVLINETLASVDKGTSLVNSIAEDIDEIVIKTDEVNNHISAIADSVKEENDIVCEVAATVGSIKDFVEGTERTSKKCVEMTGSLYDDVEDMHKIIDNFTIN